MPPATRRLYRSHSEILWRSTLEYFGPCLRELLLGEPGSARGGAQKVAPLGILRMEGIYPFQSLGSQTGDIKKLLDLCDISWAAEWDFTGTQHFHWNFQYTPIIFNKFWFYLSSWTGVFSYNLKIFKLIWLLASFFPINPQSPFQPSPLSNFPLYDKLFQINWVK